ncbi:MAG: signal peptide peptidase SppA [Pseudomonadota bacterium]
MAAVGNFFGGAWRWLGHVQHAIMRVIGLILIIIVLFALLGAIFGGDEFELSDNGVLRFEPAGAIVEEKTRVAPGDAFTTALLGGGPSNEILLRDVVEGLRLAAADEDVTAIVANFDGLAGATPAAMHEIAEEMAAFREAGKEIHVYTEGVGMGGYFLAAEADNIAVHALGGVDVSGYAIYRTYFRSLLDRLNVTVNVYRVGTFKSALEPFLGDEMSPAAEEANRFLFGDIWNAYQDRVEASRELSDGALQTYGDDVLALYEASGRDTAMLALNAGLADEVVSRAAWKDAMEERFGRDDEAESFKASGFFEYLADRREDVSHGENVVAVVMAVGSIIDGNADGGTIGGDAHAALIRRARLDDTVKAIVLRVDSGGGSVFASEVIREELERAREDGKIVIASMGGVAASGGYWISTPAHEIWAEPTTITGSIGIFGFIPTIENTLAEVGVFSDGFGQTNSAGGIALERGVNETWNELLQMNIEAGYELFLSVVGEARGMTRDEVDAVAQGRVWTGSQALERGLVDQLGGFDEAVAAAAERAGLEADDYTVKLIENELEGFEAFLADLGAAEALASVIGENAVANSPLGAALQTANEELQRINMMNDPNGMYASCLTCEAVRQAH